MFIILRDLDDEIHVWGEDGWAGNIASAKTFETYTEAERFDHYHLQDDDGHTWVAGYLDRKAHGLI